MADVHPTSFSDYSAIVEQLTGRKLSDLIRNPLGNVADCTGLCDCHNRYCGCYGSVSALERGDDVILPADYAKLRELRIAELREQLEQLERKV